MKIEVIDNGTCIEYQVRDLPVNFEQQYREILKHYYFSDQNNILVKSFRKDTLMFPHDCSLLEERFGTNLETMIKHTLGHAKMDWALCLETVAEIMQCHEIKWWLAGSAACAARGINISPQDIDIMTYKSEINKIEKAFKEYLIEPCHHVSNWIVKGFGVAYLNGRVDLAFEPEESSDSYGRLDYGYYAMNNLETIDWRGYQIQVPPVELHIPSNKVRNRTDRVRLIEDYIAHAD